MVKKKLRKKQTTVNLTPEGQVIKDQLASAFGLKYILTAGLKLFDELPADQRMNLIIAASNADTFEDGKRSFLTWFSELNDPQRQEVLEEINGIMGDDVAPYFDAVADMIEKGRSGLRTLTPKEQMSLDHLRATLGPEDGEDAQIDKEMRKIAEAAKDDSKEQKGGGSQGSSISA